MTVTQYPLDKALLVAAWLEALFYGVFVCVFFLGVYINLTSKKVHNTHNRIMFGISIVMFLIASMHLGMNCFRLIKGYVDFRLVPGGPVGYLGILSTWDHIFKDTLYATQSILGDAVGVYRCWILWSGDYRVVIVPFMLLIVSTVSGYMVCGLYTTVDPAATVFDPRLTNQITIFYATAVAQNIITTGLMATRLWKVETESARYRQGGGSLLPVLKIMVESASLYLFVEAILLSLYAANLNSQYILLEIVTPIVGITFNAIAIGISLRSRQQSVNLSSMERTADRDRHTVGSIPMRHIVMSRSKTGSEEDIDTYSKDAVFTEP
ncbi:hypothetical protein C8J57DRAFT_1553552 [Mycena rebaudengoi]|nr:hypothetical protein C8J57DRAFT_1553552 [Mycena rebaudengoi]